jgi:hypothetical protein
VKLHGLKTFGGVIGAILTLAAFNKQQACVPNAQALEQLRNLSDNPAIILYNNPGDRFKRAVKPLLSQPANSKPPRVKPTTLSVTSPEGEALRQFKVDKNKTTLLDTDGDKTKDKIMATRSQWPGGQVIIDLKRNEFANLNSLNTKSNNVVKPLFPWLNSTTCPKGMVPKDGFTE